MTTHKTGTREQWLAARLPLLEDEKQLIRRSDELAQRRQELPWVRIDKDYRFDTDEGPAWLADLFRGRSQLLVYHFMFGPDYAAGCPSCSAIADGCRGPRWRRSRRTSGGWAGASPSPRPTPATSTTTSRSGTPNRRGTPEPSSTTSVSRICGRPPAR